MTAINQNFSLVQGDDHDVVISVFDDEGEDIDLGTVDTIDWQCADPAGTVIISKTLGSGITVESVNDMRIVLPRAETVNLSRIKYRHRARVTIADQLSTVTLGVMSVLRL